MIHHDTSALGAAEGSSLIRSCPNLQSLDMWEVWYTVHLLASLQQLCSLRTLRLSADLGRGVTQGEACQLLGKLTGLRQLAMGSFNIEPEVLLPLAQLRHLTALEYAHSLGSEHGEELHFTAQVSRLTGSG